MIEIEYLTSNEGKFKEAQLILADWKLTRVNIDLTEIQGDSETVIKAKAKEAYRILQRPLIVEDVSVQFNCLNGLPGPYIKDFLIKLGEEGVVDLVHRFEDHRATVSCHAAFIQNEADPIIFEGSLTGLIVTPRGNTRHSKRSWNTIFQPEGFDKTFGEMTFEEHSRYSMRRVALSKLKHFFENFLID